MKKSKAPMTKTCSGLSKMSTATLSALLLLLLAPPLRAAETNFVYSVPDEGVLRLNPMSQARLIWDLSRVPDRNKGNLEFPYLIRFKDRWFCSFREGYAHGNNPSGRARVITSKDGRDWETAALLDWEGGDVRDPRMSVTADGKLMINSSIFFIGEPKANPAEWEVPGERQSVTWLSEDGRNWDGPYACPTGFDTWRWDVAWYDGYGYSAGYGRGKDRRGTLYRTADGKNWTPVVNNFFPDGRGTEAALEFGPDGTAYCLLRPWGRRDGYGKFGIGQPPAYTQWTWQRLSIDAQGNGEVIPGKVYHEKTKTIVGGQKLLTLSDGRLMAATAKGRCDLFWVDPDKALLTRFVHSGGVSYPGLVEYDGELWLTNVQRPDGMDSHIKGGVYLFRIKIPPRKS